MLDQLIRVPDRLSRLGDRLKRPAHFLDPTGNLVGGTIEVPDDLLQIDQSGSQFELDNPQEVLCLSGGSPELHKGRHHPEYQQEEQHHERPKSERDR